VTLQRPLVMQAAVGDTTISYSALDWRSLLDSLAVDEGVVGDTITLAGSGGGLSVTQRAAGANMSVDVSAGSCVITGDDVTRQGKYLCVSDAVTNVTIPAAPASGTRVHRIVARIKDKLHNGTWSTYEWTIEALADTGSGTPVEPASAISLATVSVTAGQASVTNSNITRTRPRMRLASAAAGAWQTYTPTAKVNGVAVSLGTGGSASGRYQFADGKICHFTAAITFGSTASIADHSNPLTVTLPTADAANGLPYLVHVHASSSPGGGTILLNGIGVINGAGTGSVDKLRFVDGSTNGDTDDADWSTAPWSTSGATPADWRSKALYISGTYERA
jgi:hypothetical protein